MNGTRTRGGDEARRPVRWRTALHLGIAAALFWIAPVGADEPVDTPDRTAAAEPKEAEEAEGVHDAEPATPRKLGRVVLHGRYAHASPWLAVSRHGWAIHVGGWPPVIVHEDGAYRPGAALGALDLDVSPEEAEIYIDGEYYGIADNFDGFPTYLWLEEGVYDLELYLEGYETVGMQITVEADEVIDVDNRLVRGESRKPRSREVARAAEHESDRPVEAPTWSEGAVGEPEQASLIFVVSPADAVVYLDGHFFGAADELALSEAGWLVSVGSHEIEVVRPGHTPVRRTVELEAGERRRLEITLAPDEPR